MNESLKSWKTTAVGIIGLIISLLQVASAALTGGFEAVEWGTVIPTLIASVAALLAKDGDKSTEEVRKLS